MTMQVKIEDKYLNQFNDFVNTLPKDAIEINNLNDNSISFEQASQKVQKAINNISLHNGLNIDDAFSKVLSN
jgi:hypothetical protein